MFNIMDNFAILQLCFIFNYYQDQNIFDLVEFNILRDFNHLDIKDIEMLIVLY